MSLSLIHIWCRSSRPAAPLAGVRHREPVALRRPGCAGRSTPPPGISAPVSYTHLGVRKRCKITDVVEKFSVIKTLQAIEDANVVLLVIDARDGISDQDLSLLGFILNSGRSLVIVVNKWDGLSQEVKEQVKETCLLYTSAG